MGNALLCKREDFHLDPHHPWKVRCGSMHIGNPIASMSPIPVSLHQDGCESKRIPGSSQARSPVIGQVGDERPCFKQSAWLGPTPSLSSNLYMCTRLLWQRGGGMSTC